MNSHAREGSGLPLHEVAFLPLQMMQLLVFMLSKELLEFLSLPSVILSTLALYDSQDITAQVVHPS